ncbi:AraC family transcriptional regulator [Brucepastera parasyntrophica]|uniref:AraC family transcriptional regulator n=1 Tax=Brucepastera parasyntrophica TaxID=2880008 RepID=UPI00210D131C|nr:GyrI-like domain-containing protein [Brucepastera parasyntrophica]ULQ58792.1 AraC family transcriptional regulator [Brucepastera parasyntrophica]
MIPDERIRRVIQYIDSTYSEPVSLEELSGIGCLSRYHLSRLFSANTGKSISCYIQEKRIGAAKGLLADTNDTITRIAEAAGYRTISNFNKIFKSKTGISPKEFRKREKSKQQEEKSNKDKENNARESHNSPISSFIRRIIEMNLETAVLPDTEIAYVSRKGSYLETGLLWKELTEWTSSHNLFPPACQFLGISYDEPEKEDDEKTYDACVILPPDFRKPGDGVLYRKLRGGDYFLYRFYDTADRLGLVYKEIVSEYLPQSEYELDNRDFLEYVMNDPFSDPEKKAKINLYIPVTKKETQE